MVIQHKIIIEANRKGYYVSKSGSALNPKGNELKTSQNKDGYLSFNIRLKGKNPTRVFLHKLQAYQKYGDSTFEKGIVVRHLNGKAYDNSINNIRIGTHSDNAMDIISDERIRIATNAIRCKQNKTRSYNDRLMIYKDIKSGMSYSKIMEKHNISSKGSISYMKNKSKEFAESV